jgi:uncharacterized protein
MRQFLAIMVVAFGLCSAAFADPLPGQGLDALRAKAEHGDKWAQWDLGWKYEVGRGVPRDYAEALRWYRQSAGQGLAEAQRSLGWMYHQGKGVPRDYAEAVKWLGKAAEQGNAIAQLALGTMYELGHGVPRADVAAYMWLSLAAAQGSEIDRKHLDSVEAKLSAGQLAEAQRMAHDWRPSPAARP